MSLIVTSSSQQDLGGVGAGHRVKTKTGIESSAFYQNHFMSPIKIPANAEIAVESVKIRRDALIDIDDESILYTYFGALQSEVDAPDYKEGRLEMPIPVRPNPGTYDVEGWVAELDERLDEMYCNPEIYASNSVSQTTNASGDQVGVSITRTQRGSSADAAKNRVNQVAELLSGAWQAPYNLSDGKVPVTDWTSVHTASAGGIPAHKLFTRVVANNASDDTVLKKLDRRECSVIGNQSPFGLVQGRYRVRVSNSSGAGSGWRVGLSRPQIEYIRDTTKTGGAGRANLLPGTRHPDGGYDDQVAISTRYAMTNAVTGRYQKDYYDYLVQDDGINIRIFHLVYDEPSNQLVQAEVTYWGSGTAFPAETGPLTKSAFNASYEYVEFVSHGDEIRLNFLSKVLAIKVIISQSINQNRQKCFAPINECKNALYPRLNVAVEGDSLQVFNWHSHYPDVNQISFRFPTFHKPTDTFTTGDDFYSNNRVGRFSGGKIGGDDNKAIIRDTKNRPYCLSQTLACDTKRLLAVDTGGVEVLDFEFDGELGGEKGINKKHVLILGYIEEDTIWDYLEGKYRTTDVSGRAKMNRLLGFKDRPWVEQTDGASKGYAVVSASGHIVTFNSFTHPDYRVHSAFVRISNMPIQSYNGGKNSVSKILYHLPRFTNDGREYGDLFFYPGEKTYVSLHNPNTTILNNIEIQIVDINEKPVVDISGNTVIVFHVREKK
jgi:hypothetical protein